MEFFPAVVTPLPLLLDRVVEYEAGKRAVGIKSVTKNEPFFNGNYPAGRPSMPGFLQVKALAQLAAIVALQIDRLEPGGAFFFFSGAADGITWKQPAVPGDVLVMEVEIKNWNQRFGIGKAEGKAYVDGIIVVQVKEMTFAILLNKQNGPP